MKIEPHDGILYMRCGEKNQRAFRLYVHVSVCVWFRWPPSSPSWVNMLSAAAPLLPDEINTRCVCARSICCVFFSALIRRSSGRLIFMHLSRTHREIKVLLLFQNVLFLPFFRIGFHWFWSNSARPCFFLFFFLCIKCWNNNNWTKIQLGHSKARVLDLSSSDRRCSRIK